LAKTVEKHVHKFKRVTYRSGNQVFFCALPDCNKKFAVALTLGKRSVCWRCGETFLMSEYSLRLAKPHCEACHKSKKEVPWVHPPTETEKEASKELLSLADRLSQTIQQAQEEDEL